MKDLVWLSVEAHRDLTAFVSVRTHGLTHPELSRDGDVTREQLELLVLCLLEMFPEFFVFFVHLLQLFVFPGGEQYDEDHNDQ